MPVVMSKAFILDEIRRTAAGNGGKPLGILRFRSVTGIRESDWQGVFWARWGDALIEAGFRPNEMQTAIETDSLAKSYVDLAKELARLPVRAELQLKRRSAPEFPNHRTLVQRFGNKRALVCAVAEFCTSNAGYDEVAALCREYLANRAEPNDTSVNEHSGTDEQFGTVYLAKSGRYYKIGKSNAAGRREYELGLQLPDKLKMVHVFKTDDPAGIEAYWHKRFDARRKNGEWFDLSKADVAAFKRRRNFM